jgi:hypothetical protein
MVIGLGARRVLGVTHGDQLEIEIALDADGRAWPDNEWVELFREYEEFPGDLEEPRLEHGKLRFEACGRDLQRAWTEIKQRVAVTNRSYAEMLLPRDELGQQDENVRREDADDRMREAQRLLDSFE